MAQVPSTPVPLWELPDVVIAHIVSFCAAPTHRAAVLCHQLAPLCHSAAHRLLQEEQSTSLWDIILQSDYGIAVSHAKTKRRECKRLKRGPVNRVRDAHQLVIDHTEICFFYLSEMVNSTAKNKTVSKKEFTKAKFTALLDEYGPHLRLNHPVSSGGVYLVEVCRARGVKESTILRCVEELIEQRSANVNIMSNESDSSSQTALCVAAVRGMPAVVRYLLEHGADASLACSGRFRLYLNSKKTLRCRDKTALEFCTAMRDAEQEAGAEERQLIDLNKCIGLLQKKNA